ncbi:9627_t:CDS:2, partial [Paraglomus occultum]
GEKYLFGRGGEQKDEKRAFNYFTRAADLHHPQAQGVLAFCYEFGLGIEKDFKQAEQHYISAAERGNGLAQARLAFLRKYGRPSVRIDRTEAEKWQQKVKDQGRHAISWLQTAAEKENHPAAQYSLGLGIGCSKDEEMAVHFFRLAAEQDHVSAMYHLANAMERGAGCEIDLRGATYWFEKAASYGCRSSCERLKRLLVKEFMGSDYTGSEFVCGHYAPAA